MNYKQILKSEGDLSIQIVKVKPKKIDRKYDKNGKLTFICPNCKYVLKRIKSEIETIRLFEECPECKTKLDWSELYG